MDNIQLKMSRISVSDCRPHCNWGRICKAKQTTTTWNWCFISRRFQYTTSCNKILWLPVSSRLMILYPLLNISLSEAASSLPEILFSHRSRIHFQANLLCHLLSEEQQYTWYQTNREVQAAVLFWPILLGISYSRNLDDCSTKFATRSWAHVHSNKTHKNKCTDLYLAWYQSYFPYGNKESEQMPTNHEQILFEAET
jgi:hypothetical protein